jgi:hypothetical protein
VALLLEVIRTVPNLRDPYRTLAALHEVMGQPRQALNFWIIAAHMGRAAKQVCGGGGPGGSESVCVWGGGGKASTGIRERESGCLCGFCRTKERGGG